jgi:hypothetical protein
LSHIRTKRTTALELEKDRIEGFEVIPDSFDYAPTGQTVVGMWSGDDTVKRQGLLRRSTRRARGTVGNQVEKAVAALRALGLIITPQTQTGCDQKGVCWSSSLSPAKHQRND